LLKNGQRLEGRITSNANDNQRHIKLITQINSIIQRARDSTLMDAEYDARLIEDLFKCEPITVKIPENEWVDKPECNHRTIQDREFIVNLYINRLEYYLKQQGLKVEKQAERE